MSGDDGGEQAAMDAGADAFLTKPIATVGQFQEVILSALPTLPAMLRAVPNDEVAPDRLAVRDDLTRVATVLAEARDAGTLAYVAQFLCGLSRSAGDAELEAAARALAASGADALDEVTDLIATRIGTGAFAA
jgi:hypothetical protein